MADDEVRVKEESLEDIILKDCKEVVAADGGTHRYVTDNGGGSSSLAEVKVKEEPADVIESAACASIIWTPEFVKVEPVDYEEDTTSCGTSSRVVGNDHSNGDVDLVDDAEEDVFLTGSCVPSVGNDNSGCEERLCGEDDLSRPRPFSCKVCDYTAASAAALRYHVRTHTGEKPFSCQVCNVKLRQKSHLVTHMMRSHYGDKPFACKDCDYRFTLASDLKRHIRTHTGEKPFSCSICSFKCSWTSSLSRHMRKHTGEKPFSCKYCNYACSNSSNLNEHIRIHTGEKRFCCFLCNYRCNRKTKLVSHMTTHTV